MNYPDEIIVQKDSSEYDVLYKHSELFRTIAEKYSGNKGEVKLSSKFFGDEWPMFVDLFFPEMGYTPLFIFKNRAIQLRSNRGTKEQLAQLLRYLLVDDEDTMMNFARDQAKKQLNAPANIVPRGIRKTQKKLLNKHRNNNNINSNYYGNSNSNPNYNSDGIELGYTKNEENLLGKLPPKYIKKYFTNKYGKRKTRRTLKL
jgi:hypothetical protein